jgi:hypothetical protein
VEASEAALVEAVAAKSDGLSEVVVSSLSPDGEWAAVLLHVLETDNWLEAVYERADGEWVEWTTSHESEAWSPIETKGGVAVGVFACMARRRPGRSGRSSPGAASSTRPPSETATSPSRRGTRATRSSSGRRPR